MFTASGLFRITFALARIWHIDVPMLFLFAGGFGSLLHPWQPRNCVYTHTQKLLHRECAQAILHTEAFTQRCSYTQKHFQLETFMRRCFCTQEVYTKSCFYTECFNATRNYTLDLSHRDAFTHNLLQTETPAFTSLHAESVATEKRLHTEAWRHTDAKRRSPQIAALYLSFGRSLSVSCRNDRLAQVLT